MTATAALENSRFYVSQLLQGGHLGSKFHQLFITSREPTEKKKTEKKKVTKKKIKPKPKEKQKAVKRDKSPENAEFHPPHIELHENPSAFSVYASIKQLVLEQQTKETRQTFVVAHSAQISDGDSDEDEEKTKDPQITIPKIVGLGLCGVFELIKETRITQPSLCTRALQALLDMLQGQAPEGLKTEPGEVIDSLFLLLMELTSKSNPEQNCQSSYSLSAVACACLISLVVGRGDTGKLLSAIGAMLMSSAKLASQDIRVPSILTSLQKSVQSALLGTTIHPDWFNNGIPDKARTEVIPIILPKVAKPVQMKKVSPEVVLHSAIASDGKYLYIHHKDKLLKVGSGYSSTIKGHVYLTRTDFHAKERGWLAYAKGMLFYKDMDSASGALAVINIETLDEEKLFKFEGNNFGSTVLFSDGEHIGRVAASKDDSFVVRTYDPTYSPMPIVSEIPLKLARKCMDVFGTAPFDNLCDIHSINLGCDEEILSVTSGKEFSLARTASGKIFYTGKSSVVGIKHGGAPIGRWNELPVTKSPRFVQYSVGHEGMHALLVTEDGTVYFTGTPKRGEDGESGLVEGRRAPKPIKPKKMVKMESKMVLTTACNYGTSALVTKDGELFMFGKDNQHCDATTGLVTDLKEVTVTQVVLGKAHAVVLTSDGFVYTFGLNNKGQCGRELSSAPKEVSSVVTMADEEDDIYFEDIICPPGNHKWKDQECMVCIVCGECTGYGNSCVNSLKTERNPGQPCGCGSGDAGCVECGICRSCAGVAGDDDKQEILFDFFTKTKEAIKVAHNLGRRGSRTAGNIGKRFSEEKYRERIKNKGAAAASPVKKYSKSLSETSTDAETEQAKTVSLSPALVTIGTGTIPVIHIASGLHHTIALLENGDVYTFGHNSCGQLGLGDTSTRGTPCKVMLHHKAVQVAAGSSHSVILTSTGMVYTFGAFQKGQLGREIPDDGLSKDKKKLWFSLPGYVPGIGIKYGRKCTWIGASGDQTYMRIDESLINAHTLTRSSIFANQSSIGLIPNCEEGQSPIKCLVISKTDGTCRSFSGTDQANLGLNSVCLDPCYDVLWSYSPQRSTVTCYNILRSETRDLENRSPSVCSILTPELAVPTRPNSIISRSNCALYMLGCLDTLTTASQLGLQVATEEHEKHAPNKIYTKEDFSVVNRFKSHGGGWGYSDHSVESIRFSTDTDILLGGFGLFGGRGLYFGKIKVFDLGNDGGESETYGDLLAETEEIPFECGPREVYTMLLDDPVPLQANYWYCAWASVSGPNSDCGACGQAMVITEDPVAFKFKSSKKSNNGTDVNAGQIPQILYRLPTADSNSGSRTHYPSELIHVISPDLPRTVTPDCFESLLKLLHWSWNTFNAVMMEIRELKGTNMVAAMLDLERLVYITTATLRLLRTYICEVFPNGGTKKQRPESTKLAEAVGETRALLRRILTENRANIYHRESISVPGSEPKYIKLGHQILEECHETFVACFHAFYPTGSLKWLCLCDLLNLIDPSYHDVEGIGRLLAAVMEALCHPTVKLSNVLPVMCEYETQLLLKQQYKLDDNSPDSPQSGDLNSFPLLIAHMTHRTEVEGIGTSHMFKDILDKLLSIVTLSVKQALSKERVSYSDELVLNTCTLLTAIISELTAAAAGSEGESPTASRPLFTTPNRFTRMSQNAYWNPGNGSPDAICFSVDRPGIVIAGVGVYGGGSHWDYELELLDEVHSEGTHDPSHTQRWNSIELAKGSYGSDDCTNNISELKFERPIPIKEGVKYAIRLRNHGPRTFNGDGGQSKVKCQDGTTFLFSACSLSSNGTNHTRGQIPHILYYSAPQEGENRLQSSKMIAEYQARKSIISLIGSIIRAATDILHKAHSCLDQEVIRILGSAQIFCTLLPLVFAYIGPVASQDPRSAVQVLNLVQEILPSVASINSKLLPLVSSNQPEIGPLNFESSTTSSHYAEIESDHPYKPATVANYRLTFPSEVKWISIEFDSQCGTAQVEDTLQLYIPSSAMIGGPKAPSLTGSITQKSAIAIEEKDVDLTDSVPVLRKFYGLDNWPQMAIVLPGNEVCFSLETASDYVKDDKACFYGFKCSAVGYEWTGKPEEGLLQLEKAITYLGGMCASALMRKDIILPPVTIEEAEEDLDSLEESAEQVFQAHSGLLGKGFALSHSLTISQALEGSLPYSWQSNERAFLKDFVACSPGTSGGRLARWLQPDSYLDPKQCEVMCNKDDLQCSWPTVITVHTKDQYGHLVDVPILKVEVKAIPVDNKESSGEDTKKLRRFSRPDELTCLIFGGHPPPRLDVPYDVTIKDKKDAYHSICMMKAYENYSFEELRFASPTIRRPSENMLVRANNDGTYAASWTPGGTGFYNIVMTIDGFETGEAYKVEVKDPPLGVTPPTKGTTKKPSHIPSKTRKFIGKHSAGLRVRQNPSLQSEEIGIIPPNGIIAFTDEIHNDDGVWVRLSNHSIKEFCSNGHTEAWCLQYNQHLGKTLLVPVDEPKSILDEIIKETSTRKMPDILREPSLKGRAGGPGVYQVVKCGPSGHNIRCHPTMKATPVGMLVLGNQLTATEDIVNAEGVWVKLDHTSQQHYCHEMEGESWSLAVGVDDIVYLQHESELSADSDNGGGLSQGEPMFGYAAAAGGNAPVVEPAPMANGCLEPPPKGFDFTNAQQVPTFTVFNNIKNTIDEKKGLRVATKGPMHVPKPTDENHKRIDDSHLYTEYGSPPKAGVSGKPPPGSPVHRGVSKLSPKQRAEKPQPLAVPPSAPPPSELSEKDKEIPPELQGVSVKDLVKALGLFKCGCKARPEKTPTSSPPSPQPSHRQQQQQLPAPPPSRSPEKTHHKPWERFLSPERKAATQQQVKPRHPSELRGLSVRDLIKVIGESRANGNGVTPPRTPPGTPKKTSSRSSSPMPAAGSTRKESKVSSPLPSTSPRKEPLHLTDSCKAAAGSFYTPPQTPPMPRASPPASSRYSSPSRSASSGANSPQRSGSPLGPRPVGLAASKVAVPVATQTSQEAIKSHFSIGASPPKDDSTIRLSPKAGRKERSRQLRSKRERAASPVSKEKPSSSHSSRSSTLERKDKVVVVKEALSPSVAECLRAVFAAFLWHEGIVHDAMACASFLKFHPNLTKELKDKQKTPKSTPSKEQPPKSNRHSVEVTMVDGASGGDPEPSVSGAVNRNFNKNQCIINSRHEMKMRDRHISEGEGFTMETSETFTLEPDEESDLPPTLQHLVYFWEQLSTVTLKVIDQNLIVPARGKRVDRKEKEKEKCDKSKKDKKATKKDAKVGGGRGGNLFGEAAGGVDGRGDRESVCELCGGVFPYPVTYHMRQAHPGCGQNAGGQGYNSAGHFCGGWAGNCGDGGIGGSSWYLICNRCREKYLKDKRQALKEKAKKTKKKSLPIRQPSIVPPLEPHLIMKSNAMFLMDLASAAGLTLPNHVQRKQTAAGNQCQGQMDTSLPSVNEDVAMDQNPFPPVPFLYLCLKNSQGADTAFAEEVIYDEEGLPIGKVESPVEGYAPARLCMDTKHRIVRCGSAGQERNGIYMSHISPQDEMSSSQPATAGKVSRSAQASPDSDLDTNRRTFFQRSISEIASDHIAGGNSTEIVTVTNRVAVRRRNNSGGVSDGGMSLIKHPSAAMSKLINSVETSPSKGSEKSLKRPVMSFIMQRHDLDSLQIAMRQALRKAACRIYAFQALNWLLRSVSQTTSLHDLLWFFVSSLLSPPLEEEEDDPNDEKKVKRDRRDHEQEKDRVCEHPMDDITIAGDAALPLLTAFHTFLQTVSDVMMYLPANTPLQQMAVRCWYLKFRQSDHLFLHKSHVFSNISKILSKSDEENEEPITITDTGELTSVIEVLKDITHSADLKASSRQAMINSLTDNSTETFWESGDEDRNKAKTITITCIQQANPSIIYVHIDNTRDLGNKVSVVIFSAGSGPDDLKRVKQVDVLSRHVGWVRCSLPDNSRVIKLEMRGPDNNLRLRQIKLLGGMEGEQLILSGLPSSSVIQQRNCESETLKVFRLLTSQVFGRLISDEGPEDEKRDECRDDGSEGSIEGENDLKEHMVGILFSRSKLTHLQKQVCAHIVLAIQKETSRVREEWQSSLTEAKMLNEDQSRSSDGYCFELLSMVLALSGSSVGRAYLAHQHELLQDLLSLLHTATPRVQRQVISLLRRVLPEVAPHQLGNVLSVMRLPPRDFSILVDSTNRSHSMINFDPMKPGIIDVFLACIAKSLTVQMKVKNHVGGKGVTSVTLADCGLILDNEDPRWWFTGCLSSKLASNIVKLLKDMASGKLSDAWAAVTKGAIAEAILGLTKLDDKHRLPAECIRTPVLWLALSSLCVLDQDHVERLSSGQWVSKDGQNQQRPTCDNHDDGETIAIILCTECGNLCADCDRFLHLHRRTRNHQRQVFKEEEESIKVDLHEGCGRTKLFWVMALADSKTLKAMVEFREGSKGKITGASSPAGTVGTCRFCGTQGNSGILAIGNVCSDPDCQEYGKIACTRIHNCGHLCNGIRDEQVCLPCLNGCNSDENKDSLKQDADDMCMICFTEALAAAPAIQQLACGHVFHYRCCRSVLTRKWVGPRITFGFAKCPICKADISHHVLKDLLDPINVLYEDVRRKALMRLEYEGLHKAEAITGAGGRYWNDPAGYAMDRYAYYVCYKCKKAYYGGEARCDEQLEGGDDYDQTELVCGGCSDVSRAQMCPKHGTDFLEYKCRYCCSVAVFFCFGTTHFCNPCHDAFQRVTNIPKSELPHCPAGPKGKQLEGDECPLHVQHPPTGEEFALGCGVCRNAHTF
ncbi:E3 ubiquitin-protein ligase MYCBP2-like [Tubulanus polymorphus]|uniref:E3 ubiquitin-protein ligase MYCBP2-like n=1 Tax=Tubulanus polymorphus TaxID=672921 RepID=UPI003DA26FD9